MYKNILVPMALDHDVSPQTIEIAKALLEDGGKIYALHVYETAKGMAGRFVDPEDVQHGREELQKEMNAKLKNYPEVQGELQAGHPARTIIDYASSHEIDCIVIGSHKPGLNDYFIGSTASRVVRHAQCAVHVMR